MWLGLRERCRLMNRRNSAGIAEEPGLAMCRNIITRRSWLAVTDSCGHGRSRDAKGILTMSLRSAGILCSIGNGRLRKLKLRIKTIGWKPPVPPQFLSVCAVEKES